VCLVVAAALTLAANAAFADDINLVWDPNPAPVSGYKVHVGTQPGTYSQHFDVGSANTFRFTGATPGQRYCFAVSAYTSAGDGPNSNEVCGFSNAPPTLTNPGAQSSTVGQTVSLQLVGSDPESQPLTYSASTLPPGVSLMPNTGFISGQATTAGTYSVVAAVSDGVLTSTSQSFTWTITTPPVADTTPPTVTITDPTSSNTYSTTSTSIPLGGTASDNGTVTLVTWVNDRGGNGMASGTTTWTVPSVPLASGTNVITVQARDAAGNLANDVLTVSKSTTTPTDTMAPTVTITGPTSGSTYTVTTTDITLTGTSADNVGVMQVVWTSNRGGSGTASGTTDWTSGSIPLRPGTNVITITASDAAGNVATDTLTVTRRRS
jgi:hypothetical protein